MSLLAEIKGVHYFDQWDDDVYIRSKRKRSPLGLLLLGSLRYIGRGWTFDDLEEATGINEETHRQFFTNLLTMVKISCILSM